MCPTTLVRRLPGSAPATGHASIPSDAGRGLSTPARGWAPHGAGDAARVSARLPRVRPPPGHPDRQRRASHPSPHASSGSSPRRMSRDTPNERASGAPRTLKRRRRRPRPTGGGSGEPSSHSYNNASATAGQALHPLGAPDYGAEVTVRRVRHNGEIKWKGDRVYVSAPLRGTKRRSASSPSRRAHRTVRTPPHRRPRRPRAADRQDPG